MKKILVLCTLFIICLSISRIFPCGRLLSYMEVEKTNLLCSTQAKCSISTDHSTCTTTLESIYDIKSFPAPFSYSPIFLGEIFFNDIHIREKNVVFAFDRPPAKIS